MSLDACPVRRAGGTAVIVLPPEIDLNNADRIGAELDQARAADTAVLIADMTGALFCDSAGVRMLIRAFHRAAAAGTTLRLAAGSVPVRRVLELTGADSVIETYPDLDAATQGG